MEASWWLLLLLLVHRRFIGNRHTFCGCSRDSSTNGGSDNSSCPCTIRGYSGPSLDEIPEERRSCTENCFVARQLQFGSEAVLGTARLWALEVAWKKDN